MQQKEKYRKDGLTALFGTAHTDALELMTIQEYKDFLFELQKRQEALESEIRKAKARSRVNISRRTSDSMRVACSIDEWCGTDA